MCIVHGPSLLVWTKLAGDYILLITALRDVVIKALVKRNMIFKNSFIRYCSTVIVVISTCVAGNRQVW